MAAFPKLRSMPEADEAPTPRLVDDARYAAAAALLSAFNQHREHLEKQRLYETFEYHFSTRGATSDTRADQQMRRRWSTLKAELAEGSPAPTVSPSSTSPAVTEGINLLAGLPIAPSSSHAARVAEIDRQIAIVGVAIREQTEIVDTIRGELTYAANTAIVPRWDAQHMKLYRSAQALSREMARLDDLAAELIGAGYVLRHDVLTPLPARAPIRIGREEDPTSEIAAWRTFLEQRGLLP